MAHVILNIRFAIDSQNDCLKFGSVCGFAKLFEIPNHVCIWFFDIHQSLLCMLSGLYSTAGPKNEPNLLMILTTYVRIWMETSNNWVINGKVSKLDTLRKTLNNCEASSWSLPNHARDWVKGKVWIQSPGDASWLVGVVCLVSGPLLISNRHMFVLNN